MTLRNVGRAAMVVAIAATSLAVAAPARAAVPLSASLSCDALGRMRVLCISSVTGGTGPYSRKWFYNNRYFPAQDNRITTSWSCTPGGTNQFNLAVVDANFEIVFATTGSGCNSGNP